MIRGSMVALITPFNEDGSVNYKRLRELIDWHVDQQTDAILVLGTTAVEDVEEVLDVTLEDGEEYDTIGGYLISRLGRVPDDGERPVLTTGQLEWKVETIVDKRIELVKVQKHTPEETEESEEA